MVVKLSEIKDNIMCIYKINFPNGKIYIGLTINLKRRMYEHNNSNKAKTPCDYAIAKYGAIEEVEILEFVEDASLLESREIYYIKLYNSTDRNIGYNITDGGKGGTRRKLSKEQVIDIRTRWNNGDSLKSIREAYKDIVSTDTVNRVIEWKSYCDVGIELKCNRIMSRSEKISENAKNRSKLTDEYKQVIIDGYENGLSSWEIWKEYFEDKNICSWQTILRFYNKIKK